jgi:hypothetical protein
VDVGIDEPGQNCGFAKIADFSVCWDLARGYNVLYVLAFDQYRAGPYPLRRY